MVHLRFTIRHMMELVMPGRAFTALAGAAARFAGNPLTRRRPLSPRARTRANFTHS